MQFRLWFSLGSIFGDRNLSTAKKLNQRLYKAVRPALRDRRLLVYVLVNIIFTTYISQLQHFAPTSKLCVGLGKGLAETTISALFAWHLALAINASCLLPVP